MLWKMIISSTTRIGKDKKKNSLQNCNEIMQPATFVQNIRNNKYYFYFSPYIFDVINKY